MNGNHGTVSSANVSEARLVYHTLLSQTMLNVMDIINIRYLKLFNHSVIVI